MKQGIVLALFCIVLSIVVSAQDHLNVQSEFLKTENSLQKVHIIQKMCASAEENNLPMSQWKIDCLRIALRDKSPLVVEQACRQIALKQISALSSDLCSLFYNADEKYVGYSERVRAAILQSFCKPITPQVRKLLIDFFQHDDGSALGSTALETVQRLQDPILGDAVYSYSKKMDTQIQEQRMRTDANPFYVFHFKVYRDYALTVVSELNTSALERTEDAH